jgi:uncharacterized protein with HEPN domain
MAKTPSIYIDDILSAIRRIETYTKELTRAEFGRDELRQDAVIRCLEIVSEASRRVPDAFKAEYGEIPWAKIAGIGISCATNISLFRWTRSGTSRGPICPNFVAWRSP